MFQQRSSFAVLNLVYYFFSPITLPSLHCSREFSGAVVAGVVREQLRVCTAHLLFFFFSTTLSRVFITPRNSRVAYDISPQPSPFVLSPSAGRLSTVWNTSPPLQAFLHPNCLMLLHVFFFREKERLLSKAALLRRNSRHRLRTNRSGRFRDVIKTVIAMFR